VTVADIKKLLSLDARKKSEQFRELADELKSATLGTRRFKFHFIPTSVRSTASSS
jgi:hypothetical protein